MLNFTSLIGWKEITIVCDEHSYDVCFIRENLWDSYWKDLMFFFIKNNIRNSKNTSK